MKTHSNDFKNALMKMGRQISSVIVFYQNPYFYTEDENYIIAENDDKLITESEQTPSQQTPTINVIYGENIYSIEYIRNGNLLQSLMEQCNIEIKTSALPFDINIGDEFYINFSVYVGNDGWQTIRYGNYIVYSKEHIVENDTWKYVCFDKMLLAMKQYTKLKVTYPVTVRNYIKAIANKIGLSFVDENNSFVNYDKLIYKDNFIEKNITYRDVLDKLSELTASNILIKDNKLKIGYPIETNDVLVKDNIKNIDVNFGETFGPINKININDTTNNLYLSYQDNTSINENGLSEINITNNPFMFNGEENEICQNIINQLKTFSYSINNFFTTGICYYEFLDLFTVTINNINYKCLLLNNEIKITQGIEESIFTDKLKNTTSETNSYENDYASSKDTQNQINQVDADKISKNNVINSINLSTEQNIIATNKIMLTKNVTATTDTDGFLDVNLDKNYIICSAIATFNSNDYGFIIPYYDYNNGSPIWKLKIEDKDNTALAETQISVVVYYFRK